MLPFLAANTYEGRRPRHPVGLLSVEGKASAHVKVCGCVHPCLWTLNIPFI